MKVTNCGWLTVLVASAAMLGACAAHGESPDATEAIVPFDPELKGGRVLVSVDVENIGEYAVGNKFEVRQFDADGHRLPEDVCDPRFLTFMRPPHKRHTMSVEGSLHPRVEKVVFVSTMAGAKPTWMDCETAAVKIHEVKISAALSQTPNASFFTDGVEGRALDLHDSRVFFFPIYSRACWGQGLVITNAHELFYPVAEGTVEAWIKPEWHNESCVLFDAANLAPGAANAKFAKGTLFGVEYDAAAHEISLSLKSDDGRFFTAKGHCGLTSGEWHHVAVTFRPDGETAVFADGKKVASVGLSGFVSPKVGEQNSGPMLFAFGGSAAIARNSTKRRIPVFSGALDSLRLSSIVRYPDEFIPQRVLPQDEHTCSLFRFENAIDGVSACADGIVEASIRADEALYPSAIKPTFEKQMPFETLNYKNLPSECDFLSLRKEMRCTFNLRSGETKELNLPDDIVPDFIEIANNGDKNLVAPIVLHPGEVDPRSYDTIRATLGLDGLDDRQKADKLFQFAIRSMDYFIWNTAIAEKGKRWADSPNNSPLRNLNSYGADMCGGLNKVASNLFTLCGDLPASGVQGYGHEFGHVFFGGKSRVYDLSGQQYFDSLEDDEPASLQEIEREPGVHVRYAKSAKHFTRLFAHKPWVSKPDYEPPFFITLRPGERIRWWRRNDGTFTDVWAARKVSATKNPLVAPAPSECCFTPAYTVNRFSPDLANGFVVYEGRQLEKEYVVDCAYTVVRGEYRAEDSDGKPLPVELSRDFGKTWQKIQSGSDGVARVDYAVRGLSHYIVRAEGGQNSRFRAMTEVQMNPRVLTGLAHGGKNVFLLKAQNGEMAEVTVGWRETAGDIKVSGAAFSGGVRGAERLVAVVDPSQGPTVLEVSGIAAATVEKGDLDVKLERVRLVLSAKDTASPYYGRISLKGEDAAARRDLTVLVGKGARLLFVDDPMKGRMLEKRGEKVSLNFAPVGEGKFMVFNLTRVPGGLSHERVGERPLSQVVDPKSSSPRRRLAACAGTRGANDWYKAAFGVPGGRAIYHWDYPQNPATSYPMGSPFVFDGRDLDHVDFEMTSDYLGGIELFGAVVIPEGDYAFQGETLKVFTSLNYDPGMIGANLKE